MFEPKRHLIKVQGGREYLPVSARLIWFHNEHPDWSIETEPIAIDMEKQYAIFRAKIFNAEGRLMAVGTKHEDVRGFPDFLEKAETGAIGRALALCGFGTQFAPELDEGVDRPVDSPQPIRNARPQRGAESPIAPRPAPAVTVAGPDGDAPLRMVTADPGHCSCGAPTTKSQRGVCPECRMKAMGVAA